MSRIGKKPVDLDARVTVQIDGTAITVSGPKGTLSLTVPAAISVVLEGGKLVVSRSGDAGPIRARHGMVRSVLQNMVVGVTTGYRRGLEFQGVGYRGQMKGAQHVSLSLGFSGPVEYDVPEGVTVTMPDPTHIMVEGPDKQLVGEVASSLRAFRPPDAYQGKGLRYLGEKVTLKEGKTVG
jgi:large subunit ribosomal protein L6